MGWKCITENNTAGKLLCIQIYPLTPGAHFTNLESRHLIGNYIDYKVWGEIACPFPNFKGCTVEGRE